MKPDDMAFLAEVVRTRSGLALAADKRYLVESRLTPVARQEEFESVEALVEALRSHRNEALMWAATEALTTSETSFFRDKAPFEQFRDEVLPALAASRSVLRVWCAACATGQEPFSLAMLMDEVGHHHPKLKLDLCASDISGRCVHKAQSGLFSRFEVQRGLPIGHLIRYFDEVEEAWRAKPALRQAVRWRTFNLLDDPKPLGRFDVVFCRNVLSDFEPSTRTRVLEQIASVTAPDGYLFLGAEETALGITEAFRAVEGKAGLFTRDPEFRRAA